MVLDPVVALEEEAVVHLCWLPRRFSPRCVCAVIAKDGYGSGWLQEDGISEERLYRLLVTR